MRGSEPVAAFDVEQLGVKSCRLVSRLSRGVLRNSPHHWKLEKRRRSFSVVDDVGRHPNVGVAIAIVRQYRMTAVGFAGTAREIAAGDVDLEAMTGPESVTNMAEIDGQALDAIRRKMARLNKCAQDCYNQICLN